MHCAIMRPTYCGDRGPRERGAEQAASPDRGSRCSRWRVPFGSSVFHCISCGARLTFSRDSARRVGAVGGLALFGAAALGGLVLGFDQIWTWRFMVSFLVFALVLGHAAKVFVGVFELRDDLR